jgi:nucleoside-diphosphate-sugar epimerase
MTTVLVTGATGFIASHLILALIDVGYSVRSTARSANKADHVNRILSDYAGKPVEIELVSADLMHEKGWAEAMDGVTYVQCEITDPVGPSCHLGVGDGQGDPNDPRSARDSSQEANP